MASHRAAALFLLSGLIAAVSCGSDDDPTSAPPEPTPGDAGGPDTGGELGMGAVPSQGGDGSTAGGAGAAPGTGGAGAPAGGAPHGGESPTTFGGAGGEAQGGESGAAGAGGAGGEVTVPPVFADDFDEEKLETTGTYSQNYVEFSRWNVARGTVDVTVLPNGALESPGGYGPGQLADGVVVDLNGATSQSGTLETKAALTFLPGVRYTLRYVLGNARNQPNAVTVSLAGLVSVTHTQSGLSPFTAHETSFTPLAKLSAKLVFTSDGGADDDGLLLDEVSIRR